jgi:hypothetical protein
VALKNPGLATLWFRIAGSGTILGLVFSMADEFVGEIFDFYRF